MECGRDADYWYLGRLQDGSTPMMLAVGNKDEPCVRALAKLNADVNHQGKVSSMSSSHRPLTCPFAPKEHISTFWTIRHPRA